MTDKTFTKPMVVQDFQLAVSPEDIKDGKLTPQAREFLERALLECAHRFVPKVSPGGQIMINVRMETQA